MLARSWLAVVAISGLMTQAPAPPTAAPAPPGATPLPTPHTQSAVPPKAPSPPDGGGKPADPPFLVDSAVAPNQPDLVMLLDSDGVASFRIIRRSAESGTRFTLSVSDPLDASGQPFSAVLMAADRPVSNVQEDLTAPKGVLRLQLRVAPPRPPSRLTGTLTLTTEASSIAWRLQLQPPAQRPATLAIDNQSQVLHLAGRRWLPWPELALNRGFSVSVFDKSNASALEDVWVRLEQVAKGGTGFNLSRDISFDPPLEAMAGGRRALPRVAAGTPAVVRGTVNDLKAGEYNVTLRFGASNSAADDAQKMTLALFVKDGWLPPLLVLVGAVFASFLATKFVVARRENLELQARIAKLDASWLRNEPATSAVVWAQANLHLANRAIGSSTWAKPPDLVSGRVKDVEDAFPTLRTIRDLRSGIDLACWDYFIRRRAGLKLGRFAAMCSDPPVSGAVLAQVGEGLKALEPWSKLETAFGTYWADLRKSVEHIVGKVDRRLDEIHDSEQRAAVADVVEAHKRDLGTTDAKAPAPDDAASIEQEYCTLDLLWSNRYKGELFQRLVQARKKGHGVQELFKIIDDDAWNRVKLASQNENGLRILGPSAPPQAFEPFTVTLVTGDTELDDSIVFKEKLRYQWTIHLKQPTVLDRVKQSRPFLWLRGAGASKNGGHLHPGGQRKEASQEAAPVASRQRDVLKPSSVQPAITQYSPWNGVATIGVELWRGSDRCAPRAAVDLPIEKSAAFSLARSFETTDRIPLMLAFVVAIATGMSTLYAGNATFGSLGDYLTLFLWGAAIDQSKNILQKAVGDSQSGKSGVGAPAAPPATPDKAPTALAEKTVAAPPDKPPTAAADKTVAAPPDTALPATAGKTDSAPPDKAAATPTKEEVQV